MFALFRCEQIGELLHLPHSVVGTRVKIPIYHYFHFQPLSSLMKVTSKTMSKCQKTVNFSADLKWEINRKFNIWSVESVIVFFFGLWHCSTGHFNQGSSKKFSNSIVWIKNAWPSTVNILKWKIIWICSNSFESVQENQGSLWVCKLFIKQRSHGGKSNLLIC